MAIQMQQRLLWGGGILVLASSWFLPTGQELVGGITVPLVLGCGGIALWLKVWSGRQRAIAPDPTHISSVVLEQTMARTKEMIHELEGITPEPITVSLQQHLAQLKTERDRQELHLVVMGGPGVGKSTLRTLLQTQWLPHLSVSCTLTEQDLPTLAPIAAQDVIDPSAGSLTALPETITQADLALYVIQGDLTAAEYQCWQQLQAQRHRVLVIFNQQDQYLPAQRSLLQQTLQQRLQSDLVPEDLVAITTQPQPVRVRRHQRDGTYTEVLEHPTPQLDALTQRLTQVITTETEQLILQQTYRKTRHLQTQIQHQLNLARRQLALPIIERYQWITAATAFANPFATLDLLAAAAITGKMVIELGHLYKLKFSLDQAQAVATTLATTLLKLGLVEVSTQALSSLLKGHTLTFVAGGLIQGTSAAHLSRVAGLSLVEHFQTLSATASKTPEANWQPQQLKQILTRVFQEEQRLDMLKNLVTQAVAEGRLSAIGRFQQQGKVLETAS
jgi:uncharacterized protein (DUF697 family)